MRLLDRPFLAFLASLACFALDGAMAAGPIRYPSGEPPLFRVEGPRHRARGVGRALRVGHQRGFRFHQVPGHDPRPA